MKRNRRRGDTLVEYRSRRDFSKTPEPSGGAAGAPGDGGLRYLIQKHAATRLHFDLRLEHQGTLMSWAVTRGPSLDPRDKRLAVHVEDHPLDYGDFEGTIPKGEYGGGTVMLWDEGTWDPVGDPAAGLAKGDFKFVLHGERLKGKWVLVRIKPKRGERSKHENWLLIKEKDAYATEETKPLIERALTSVRSGRTMQEIAEGNVEWIKSGFNIKRDGRGRAPTDTAVRPPKFVRPQLCTLAEAPPVGDDWLHEIKLDGYRIMAAVAGDRVTIYTRRGLDWTDKFPSLLRSLADLPCRSVLLDGEAAVADNRGRTDFGALQDAIGRKEAPIGFHMFDLLAIDGEDLRRTPLLRRKTRLAELLRDQPRTGPLFYADHLIGHGAEMLKRACAMDLEGIVSKRTDAVYRSDRTKTWLKIKCGMGDEFVIVGWKPSEVKARPFSSILIALRDSDRLAYAGRIGSGFGDAELAAVWPELKKREISTPAADDIPADVARTAHFVKPELVAEIDFRGWTGSGIVRQGSFKGLRADKRPMEVVAMGKPPAPGRAAQSSNSRASKSDRTTVVSVDKDTDHKAVVVEGVRLTHPDKVIFPGQGITKRALVDYYLAVADRILPHVAERPLSLVRCPDGAGGDCFFQKHASPGFPKAFKPVRIQEKSGSDTYLYIVDRAGLVACVQMGALELHIWGARNAALEMPDRLVFDLDPDEEVGFKRVVAAAREVRDRLKTLGLESFPMVTGGKGIHVVVPLAPRHGWTGVKDFAEAMARTMAAEAPDRYLAVATKRRRKDRIFIDYLRNGRGATAIAPYSTRARHGAPLAWPVRWPALGRLAGAQVASVENADALLKRMKADPWAGYADVDQALPLERLGGGR